MSGGYANRKAMTAMRDVCKGLRDRFHGKDALMPLMIFQARGAEREADVRAMVRELHDEYSRADLMSCCLPEPDPSDAAADPGESVYAKANARLRDLADPRWGNRDRRHAQRLSFPRSRLVTAIEDALKRAQHSQGPLGQRVISELREMKWRPVPTGGHRSWAREQLSPLADINGLIGAVVLVLLTTLLALVKPLTLAALVPAALVPWLLWRLLPSFRPQVLWFSQANRWYTRTTFLAYGREQGNAPAWSWWRPARSWRAMRSRTEGLADVLKGLAGVPVPAGEYQQAEQYLLQLRTLALLEDLRVNYAPWKFDLRRRKRIGPPMLFMPTVNEANGGTALLGAVNDIRCRRSEVDPLLVVAAVGNDEWRLVNQARPLAQPSDEQNRTAQRDDYDAWAGRLLMGQSPSARPWLLRRMIGDADLVEGEVPPDLPRAEKVPWRLRLWSKWSLVTVVLLVLGGITWSGVAQEHHYCGSGFLSGGHDLLRVPDLTGTGTECIGVTDGSYHFDTSDYQLSDGTQGPAEQPGRGATITEVEKAIATSNQEIGGRRHITVVYAGPLSAWQPVDSGTTPLRNGLEELTGVAMAQNAINNDNSNFKLRVLIANGGQDMRHQYLMARQIVRVAARDRTVVGVVGLGRDTGDSDETVRLLGNSGLPVVDTTNSSAFLRDRLNYFGLAGTDEEEANALAGVTHPAGHPTAVILTPGARGTDDLYSRAQSQDALTALRGAGYRVLPTIRYASTNFSQLTDTICGKGRAPLTIYLAARQETFKPLMSALGDSSCTSHRVTVLTGDDLTKLQFGPQLSIPPNVTIDFAALSDPAITGEDTSLLNTEFALPLLREHNGTYTVDTVLKAPIFQDGTLAMAWEAVEVMNAVAETADATASGYRYAVLSQLPLKAVTRQPTGDVDFSSSHTGSSGTAGHGLLVFRVSGGTPQRLTPACVTQSGSTPKTPAYPLCTMKDRYGPAR